MTTATPIYLTKDQVERCLLNQWDDLTSVVGAALKSFSLGQVVQPVRSVVPVRKHNGMLLAMPGYSMEDDVLATKVLTLFPDNSAAGLPTIQSVVLLYTASTGTLQAILDGQVVTNMRTAAASAVATKYLANKESKVLAILGAGNQARSHYQVLSHFYDFQKVCIWNKNKSSGIKLVEEIRKDGRTAEFHAEARDAVEHADIIVTVTLSKVPVLQKDWVKPGAHINAVGACDPDSRELSDDLVLSSTVYVDSREGALVEAGDIIQTKATIYAEIGQVIAGTKEAHPERITIFKSLGMAVEDVVTAKLVLQLHEKNATK